MRLSFKEPRWLLALGILALCCAAVTAFYFSTYATPHPVQNIVAVAAMVIFLAFTITAPGCLAMALFAPGPKSILAAKVHAALYTAFIIVSLAASRPINSSPADTTAAIMKTILLAILAFELLVVGIAIRRARNLRPSPVEIPWIFTSLVAAVVGGWTVGVLVWAVQMPPRVITAAEATAQGRPYCIDVDGVPARGVHDLTGVTMLSRENWNFHALLVIGEGPERVYFNWSYATGSFQPVNDYARKGLHLDAGVRCKPTEHFARNWL